MSVRLHVWGRRACFARPEFRRDRVSYDVITPLAARAMLEAVHWRPAILWHVDTIHVLRPIRFERSGNVVSLVEPAYLIEGHFTLTQKAGPDDSSGYHQEAFVRRGAQGRTFRPMRLGSHDFPGEFSVIGKSETAPPPSFPKTPERIDLGWMVHDIDFADEKAMKFFRAEIVNGTIFVPPRGSGVLAC